MISDEYKTIESISIGEYKEKGSKFLAYCIPFDSETKLPEIMETLKSEHPKARHYCFAYKIGIDNNRYRTNDDGEPSGTAGKPIFGQILSYNLTNVLVVVIRYFGGTKLGASGLIHAYKEATSNGFSKSNIVSRFLTKKFILNFGYEHMGKILSALKENDIEIISKDFNEDCTIVTEFHISKVDEKIIALKADLLNITHDEVTINTVIDYCSIAEITV